jgi:hypothetical protein
MEMLGRVPILRVVAATDVSAGPAEAQMDPGIAQLEALLATATAWTVGSHKIQMTTLCRHYISTEPFTPVTDAQAGRCETQS